MSNYYMLLTTIGQAKLAHAIANEEPLELTEMGLGDGNYTPNQAQTSLVSEVWRGPISLLSQDEDNPGWVVADVVLLPEVGGFYVREVGIFDSDGDLFAVARFPETYKPLLAEGSGKDLVIRAVMEVGNADAVTLVVDPSLVLAGRQYVDQSVLALESALLKDPGGLKNLGLAGSVSNKALTVALKGQDGHDPSTSNPVYIAFRSPDPAIGHTEVRKVVEPVFVSLSSGSTLGFDAEEGRLYVWAIDNAGVVELALSRHAIFPDSLVSTVAEGGLGGADSDAMMYAISARANVPCRCVGYLEIETGAVPGEWDNEPSKIQVMGPGVNRTGDVVQEVRFQTGAHAQSTLKTPWSAHPQITDGEKFMEITLTPKSAANILRVTALAFVDTAGGTDSVTAHVHRDAIDAALGASISTNAASYMRALPLSFDVVAGSVSPTTFQLRAGAQTYNVVFNGSGGSVGAGGSLTSFIQVTEIFA